jgi:hypothetical protein
MEEKSSAVSLMRIKFATAWKILWSKKR